MFDFDELDIVLICPAPSEQSRRRPRPSCRRCPLSGSYIDEDIKNSGDVPFQDPRGSNLAYAVAGVEVEVVKLSGDLVFSSTVDKLGTISQLKGAIQEESNNLDMAGLQLMYGAQVLSNSTSIADLERPQEGPIVLYMVVVDLTAEADELANMLQNKDESISVRRHAAVSLGRMGVCAGSHAATLAKIAADESDEVRVRIAAVDALSSFGASVAEHGAIVLTIFENAGNESGLHKSAAQALGRIGVHVAEPLAAFLEDPDEQTRNLASDALGRIGAAAAPHISKRLQHDDAIVRIAALHACSLLGDTATSSIGCAVAPCLEDPLLHVRVAAIEACRKSSNAEALTACLASGTSQHFHKEAAGDALSTLDESTVPWILPLLRSEYWYSRYQAIALLVKFGSPQLLSPDDVFVLKALAHDRQDLVRGEAIHILEKWYGTVLHLGETTLRVPNPTHLPSNCIVGNHGLM